MNKFFYLSGFFVLFLVGCGDDSDNVKDKHFTYVASNNQTYTYDDSFTIGEAFDNRKVCSDIEWSSFEDTRKRKIVQYECTFDSNEFKKFFTDWLEKRKIFEQESFKEIISKKLIPTGYGGEEKVRKDVNEMITNLPKKTEEKYSKAYIPSSAKEVYQWVISSDDGNPKYVYNDLSMSFDDGHVLTCQSPLIKSLELIYKNAPLSHYADFIRTVRRNVGVESGLIDNSGVIPEPSYFIKQGIDSFYADDYRDWTSSVYGWDSKWIYGIYSNQRLKCHWD